MKWVLIFIVGLCESAFGAPDMDKAAGGSTAVLLTVVPDSEDPDLFYYFPVSYAVSRQSDGTAEFLYEEFKNGWGTVKGYVSMILTAKFHDIELDARISEIRSTRPQAKFTPITFLTTSIIEPNLKSPMISAADCQLSGGVIDQEVACKLRVKSKYRRRFVERVKTKVMDWVYFNYDFSAIVNGKHTIVSHTIPVKFGDLGSGNYFYDEHGNPID